MSTIVQKQFNPTKSTTSGSGGTPDATQQSCTVSVLDFATSPPPRPPEPKNRSSGGPAAELDTGHAAGRYRMPELFVDRIINRARKAPRRSRPVTESINYVRVSRNSKMLHVDFPSSYSCKKGNGIFGEPTDDAVHNLPVAGQSFGCMARLISACLRFVYP